MEEKRGERERRDEREGAGRGEREKRRESVDGCGCQNVTKKGKGERVQKIIFPSGVYVSHPNVGA